MCHIITAISNKPLGKEVADKLIGASYVAYQNNSHMEGMYVNHDDAAQFSVNKTTFNSIRENIEQSTMAMYHARLSTSGLGFENVQPFIQDGFVFAHNGIYQIKNQLENKDKSDSRIVFEAFLARIKDKDVPTAYQEAIEAVCNYAASFSTFIYDVVKQELWYTKSSATSIICYDIPEHNLIVFSSRDVRVLSEMAKNTYKIENNTWYYVPVDKDDFCLMCAGKATYKIPEREVMSQYNHRQYGYKFGLSGYWEDNKFYPFDLEDKKKEEDPKKKKDGDQLSITDYGLGRNEDWDWDWELDDDEWNESFLGSPCKGKNEPQRS